MKSASTPGTATPDAKPKTGQGMAPLVLELLRPYRGWLAVVFAAMLVETIMSIAAPWPLMLLS